MTAASLTGHLGRWSDDRLRRLLRLRPDLCHPPVPDLAALAARAGTQMSVLRALDALDRAHLDVLEALVVLARLEETGVAPTAGPVCRERLAAFLVVPAGDDSTRDGTPGQAGDAALAATLAGLEDALLVVPDQQGWRVPLAVTAALGPHPLGLGRALSVLQAEDTAAGPSTGNAPGVVPVDREGLLATLAGRGEDPGLIERAASALDALQASPVARLPEPPGPVHALLLGTGLLVHAGRLPDGTAVAEHPLEAGLAWRDGTAGRRFDPSPPAPGDGTVPAALSANACLAAVTDLLRGVEELLSALAPGLPTLRSGGVGVREVRRLADAVASTPEDTSWLLELLVAAGLVLLDPDTSRWTVAAEADRWRRSERHRQWEVLVLGWLGSGRAPLLGPPVPQAPVAGDGVGRAGTGGPGRALAPDRNRPDAPRLRAGVLETARELDAELGGVRLDEEVARRRRWRSPRRSVRTEAFTAPLLAECARLGLTGAGALTTAGALVAEGRIDEAAAAVGTALPPPVSRVRLQGDLTAVAPGYLDPEVSRALALMADPEGDGAATVYRFSDDSVHRAFDAGLDADAVEEFLAAHSTDEVPQALRYLVRDVARRHGAVSVGPAGSWLRVDDAPALEAILADPAVAAAGLERLAPTVAVAVVDDQELHRLLTAAGHRPSRRHGTAGPGPAPTRQEPRPDATTTASPFPAPVQAARWSPSEEELSAQVARLREAPRPAPSGTGPEESVALLRHAARHGTELDLLTVDREGRRQWRRVVPLAVAGGRLRCRVTDGDTEAVVPLHRVVAASPAGPPQAMPVPAPAHPHQEDPCPTDR